MAGTAGAHMSRSRRAARWPSPAAEAQAAAAGPLTSLLLGVVFVGLALLVGTGHPVRASIPGVMVTALTGRAASQGRRTSAAIAGGSTHRRLFTISTFTSTHQFRLRDSEPRRFEHVSAAVDCLAAPGT